jgi:nucleoside-diphosphate-sugar epimerase
MSPFSGDPGFGLVHGDVCDAQTVDAALRGVGAVCHLAAMVGLSVDFGDAPLYAGCNDLGTAVLLAAMARAEASRLVLASSMVVYGEGAYSCAEHGLATTPPPPNVADLDAGRFEPCCERCGEPLSSELVPEEAPLGPRNVYAATKVAQEHLAGSWARATGGQAVALRYHNVYDPGMPRDTPYAGVASFFRSALAAGRAPRVFEDGAQRWDFIHVGSGAQPCRSPRGSRSSLQSQPATCRPDGRPIQEQAGSLISKQQPTSVFTTRTLPWWASTTPRTIARPRPAPLSGAGLRASVPRQARSNT